jgi:hypothetical protein
MAKEQWPSYLRMLISISSMSICLVSSVPLPMIKQGLFPQQDPTKVMVAAVASVLAEDA